MIYITFPMKLLINNNKITKYFKSVFKIVNFDLILSIVNILRIKSDYII